MKRPRTFGYAHIRQLQPKETLQPDASLYAQINLTHVDFKKSDNICLGLEELARHLRQLDEEFQNNQFERLGNRARNVVVLADQLGLRQIGQVAADVTYCVDYPDSAALSATLSRLIRLITNALDSSMQPMSEY